jgi:hypothetical protein
MTAQISLVLLTLLSKYLGCLKEAIPSPPLDPTAELNLSCSWAKCQNKSKTIVPVKYEN